jgi:enoyl-[acyl-carrier protein] reductase I
VLLDGSKVLVTGVLTRDSIATSVARLAQQQGAEVILTSFGRARRLTERIVRHLERPAEVLELDVTEPDDFPALAEAIRTRWGHLDGVLHAVAFAPESCLGDGVLAAPWHDVSTALQVSAYSLAPLAAALSPLMPPGSAIVGLDFDGTRAYPKYDWMGVAKAALEATARYVARDLGPAGIRVNLVAAGPLRTLAARSIPGFDDFEAAWSSRAPLGWDVRDPEPVAKACVALLSDWFCATTGEIVHVDGGFGAVAIEQPPVDGPRSPAVPPTA